MNTEPTSPDQNKEQNDSSEMIKKGTKKENPLLNLLFNIIIPFLIMTKLSKPEYLGQVYGLVTALAFPFLYGIYDLIGSSKVNYFSLLGLASILLTGGIGLLELDKTWMIAKETAIPLLIGIFVFATEKSSKPFVKNMLGQVIDLDKIADAYKEHALEGQFRKRLSRCSYLLGITFFISAFLNFALAVVVLHGEPGTPEFVESIGRMTFLSYPVIAVPSMIMVGFIMWYLFKDLEKEVGLNLESVFKQ